MPKRKSTGDADDAHDDDDNKPKATRPETDDVWNRWDAYAAQQVD